MRCERQRERRRARHDLVPRHDGEDAEHRADVEQQDSRDQRRRHRRDRPRRLRGLGGDDGDDLGARQREHDARDSGQHCGGAERRKAAVRDEVAERGAGRRRQAERVAAGDDDERDDRRDLDRREPELELAVRARRQQVRRRQQHHEHEADLPDGQRDPGLQDRGARDRLDADDDDPEVPVEPAADEPGPGAEARARMVRERQRLRVGRRHLGQHAHHEEHQRAGDRIADEHGRADGRDVRAAADEQPRADDAADRDQRDVTRPQGAAQRRYGGRR